jgi:hypothetical protein
VFVLFTEEKRKPAMINLVRCPSAKSFTFQDLALATQNFNNLNLIGEGGFGRVFKGRLENGQVIQPLMIYWKFGTLTQTRVDLCSFLENRFLIGESIL